MLSLRIALKQVFKGATMEKTQINPTNVVPGDLMAFIYYGKIKDNTQDYTERRLKVVDVDRGAEFEVRGNALIKEAYSADKYNSVEEVTKTKVAEILSMSFNRPFTVCFQKTDGSERVLRGRLIQPEPLLGRSHVEDLDITLGKTRLRLVDHRTLRWLIVNNIRYVVK